MTSPVSLELQLKIAEWRRKAAENSLTLEEMKEAIIVVRQGRMNAAASATSTKRKTAKAAIPSAGDLLNELEGL